MKKFIIIALALVGIGIGVFLYLRSNSNERLAKAILDMGGTGGDVSAFDKPFLKAWKKGLENGEEIFEYNNAAYYSKGGKKAY